MKQLILLPLFFLVTASIFGQNQHNTASSAEACETCQITNVKSSKTVSYHQYIVEEFTQTEFDTKYMIQYAIVSEVITMPMNAMAVSFQTNEGLMYMIVSATQYNSRKEAMAAGERAKSTNHAFCNYFIKPLVFSKSQASPVERKQTIAKRNVRNTYQRNTIAKQSVVNNPTEASPYAKRKSAYIAQKVVYSPDGATVQKESFRSEQKVLATGKYRVQFTWTKDYPFETLDRFMVEEHRGGYRQVSTLTFDNKQEAGVWLQNQGYAITDFWVYPL